MSYYEQIKMDMVINSHLFSLNELDVLKNTITSKNLESLKRDMECLFNWQCESVTEKENAPPDGSLHDYVSLATYWWPNEQSETKLPYIRRDGLVNPEGLCYDKERFKRFAYLTYHGSLLYFLTGDERYLELVKRHLYHWFVAKDTRMNPHLEYGQFIPGVVRGRAEGIIDYSAVFLYSLNMIHLLNKKSFLETELKSGIEEWHRDFRMWLLESGIGKQESRADNNHGVFYDLALFVLERFLGMDDSLKSRAECFLRERIEKQISSDGSLPRETARTRSLSYTLMCLRGFLDGAKIMRDYGYNFFPAIKKSVDWFCDAAIVNRATWTHPQVTPFDNGTLLVFKWLLLDVYGQEYAYLARYIDDSAVSHKALVYLWGDRSGNAG